MIFHTTYPRVDGVELILETPQTEHARGGACLVEILFVVLYDFRFCLGLNDERRDAVDDDDREEPCHDEGHDEPEAYPYYGQVEVGRKALAEAKYDAVAGSMEWSFHSLSR